MSNQLINEMRSIRLPPVSKAVLWVLCDVSNDEGMTYGYAPLSRLIDETCYQRNAVVNALAWLESVGLILGNRANGRKTTYKITLDNADYEAIDCELNRKKIASTRIIHESKPVDENNQLTRTTSRPEHKQPVDQKTEPVDQKTRPVDQANTIPIIHINHQKQPIGHVEKSQSKWDVSKVVLPDFVNVDSWNGFVEMRLSKKKPITTQRTAQLILNELASFKAKGLDPDKSLDNSTKNGWTDVYAPKEQAKPQEAYKGNVNAAFGNPQMQPPSQEEIDEMAALQAEFKRRHG